MVELAEKEVRKTEYTKHVTKAYETVKFSKLYGDFYYPEEFKGDLYEPNEGFGFLWPKEDDLVNICIDNNIKISDLVLEKVCWKAEGCGFSMLQLVFKNGITSPPFSVNGCDTEEFKTSNIKFK